MLVVRHLPVLRLAWVPRLYSCLLLPQVLWYGIILQFDLQTLASYISGINVNYQVGSAG
jgi:hypothetical protein